MPFGPGFEGATKRTLVEQSAVANDNRQRLTHKQEAQGGLKA